MMARQLGSPKAMERMAAYLEGVRPQSMELIADELLAIRADADAWRRKKESREAQAGYSVWLGSDLRRADGDEDG